MGIFIKFPTFLVLTAKTFTLSLDKFDAKDNIVKTFTADDEYFRHNRENLPLPI